jgi:hypothetical protein
MADANRPTARDLGREPATGQPDDRSGGMAGGAFAGGTAGAIDGTPSTIAERIDPRHEDEYWRNEFPTRTYAAGSHYGWEHYEPAFRMGWERYPEHHGRAFDEVEPQFAQGWASARGASALEWDDARPATRDAFERLRREFARRAVSG